MFCSNCGKTIRPNEPVCPSCGASIGEDHFRGNIYTSAQVRVAAERTEDASADGRLVASYTRTDYMSYDNPPEENVYTGTAYRPLLRDEEDIGARLPEEESGEPSPDFEDSFGPPERPARAPKAPEEPEAEEPAEDAEDEEGAAAQAADAADEEQAPAQGEAREDEAASADEEPLDLPPLKPVTKGAIRPEVERYMQKLDEQASGEKARPAIVLPFGRKSKANEDEAPAAGQAAPSADDGYLSDEDEGGEEDAQGEAGSVLGVLGRFGLTGKKLINVMIAAALIVVFIVGGAVWLSYVTSARASKLPGVSPNTYKEGIALLSERVSDEYRADFIEKYLANTAEANALLSADAAALSALMPEAPLENDQRFVDMLLNIQEGIGAALKQDAAAQLSGTPNEVVSANAWRLIQSAVNTLSNATSVATLTSIGEDLAGQVVPTPTPAPTATPAAYATLSNGMLDSVDVKRMQYRLINLGYLSGDPDGDFGNMTEAAVKAFQTEAGLTVTGIADSDMQTALYADDAPNAPVIETPAPQS